MNNAKQKAKELVVKLHYQICSDNDIDVSDSTLFCAKQTALIAVEEIINACPIELIGNAGKFKYTEDFWNEVKTEINKL